MADSFEIAYLYARICGAFSNMKLGEAGRELLSNTASIAALWKLNFREEPPAIPESRLILEAERRIIQHSIRYFLRIVKPLSDSDAFIRALIAKYEISVIKSMLFRIRAGEPKPDVLSFTSPIIEQALDAWPRLEDMFQDSPYAWLDSASLDNLAYAENRLDRQYYAGIWKAAMHIPSSRRGAIPDLVRWEIIFQNVVWALRVRRYYHLSRKDVEPMMVTIDNVDTTSFALQTFDYDIDRLESFEPWPLRPLLSNQPSTGLDVPAFEIHLQEKLFLMVRRALHLHPFSYTPVYCYFKLLEFETAFLLAAFESARLGVAPEQKSAYIWVPGGGTA